MRRLLVLSAVVALLTPATASALSSQSYAPNQNCDWNDQSFIVPAGVSSVTVDAWGRSTRAPGARSRAAGG